MRLTLQEGPCSWDRHAPGVLSLLRGDCVWDSVQHVGRTCCPGLNKQKRSARLPSEVTRGACLRLSSSTASGWEKYWFKYWAATSFWRAGGGGGRLRERRVHLMVCELHRSKMALIKVRSPLLQGWGRRGPENSSRIAPCRLCPAPFLGLRPRGLQRVERAAEGAEPPAPRPGAASRWTAAAFLLGNCFLKNLGWIECLSIKSHFLTDLCDP